MIPDSVGAGTVKRLGGLPTGGGPVLSVYLDLEADTLCTPGGRDAQLGSLLSEPGLRGALTDIECVRQLLRSDPWLARGARGLAIFSSAEASMLEAVRLPSEVRPMLVLDTEVWLEPLADMVAQGDWGVAVLGRHSSRLFRGGPSALGEFAQMSHANAPERADRVSRIAEQLLRAHRRRRLAQLVIVACDELRPLIAGALDPDLEQVVTGIVEADLERASAAEILAVITPLVEGAERTTERALLARLEESLEGGEGVTGLDQTLELLASRRVEVLLIAQDARLTAGQCPRCEHVSTVEARCACHGVRLISVDAVGHAVKLASEQAARVVVMRHESDALTQHGSIAALIRVETNSTETNPPSTKEASHAWSTHTLGPIR